MEVVSGMALREFLEQRVLGPLRTNDTSFWVPPEKLDRITSIEPGPPGTRQWKSPDLSVPTHGEAGGSGLVSTASDYARLLQMLLNGGTLDGVHLLDRKSVEQMTSNQLDRNVRAVGPTYYPGPGYGYGFGFAVRKAEPTASDVGTVGNYHIEGIYNTFAFVDPKQDLLAVLMVQAMKWLYYRPTVKELVLGSVVN